MNEFIRLLMNGKQIRITLKKENTDGCEHLGWWLQELWRYDLDKNIFKCFYPISSYVNDFYTVHSYEDTIKFMSENMRIYSLGEEGFIDSIELEDNPEFKLNTKESIKSLAIKKIESMDEDEIIRRIFC